MKAPFHTLPLAASLRNDRKGKNKTAAKSVLHHRNTNDLLLPDVEYRAILSMVAAL